VDSNIKYIVSEQIVIAGIMFWKREIKILYNLNKSIKNEKRG